MAATIIESDAVAAGASGAAAGSLTPPLPNESSSPLFELQRRGYDMHLDLAEVLPGSRNAAKDDLWIGEASAINGVIMPSEEPGFGVTVNKDLLP